MNIFTQRRGSLLLAIGFVAGSVLSAQPPTCA